MRGSPVGTLLARFGHLTGPSFHDKGKLRLQIPVLEEVRETLESQPRVLLQDLD